MTIPQQDYHLLFNSTPTPCLILAAGGDFVIVEVNEAYLRATKQTRESLIGRHMFDAFPDNPADPGATGTENLLASLQRAITTCKADVMAVQRYDIPRPDREGGGFEERYWSPVNTPVLAPDGQVQYIIHRVEDVTQFVQLTRDQARGQNERDNLVARNEEIMAELINRGEQLNEANKQLRREANRKNEFLAMLAHELRNPLAAVANVVHLLEPLVQSGSATEKHLGVLQRQVRSLKILVDSLLDVSRLTQGLVDLTRERVDLAEIVDHAVDVVNPLVREKHHTLSVDRERPVFVDGDAVRLEQVMVNLLTNAVRYTAPEGHIAIHLRQHDRHVELRVSDNGVGLAGDMLHQIFDIFAQGERELARTEGGLGIGLTVVKNLVELHGGRVTAHSEGLGRGSQFTVRLPLAATAAVPSPSTSEHNAQFKPRHILIVEDNTDIADTMAAVLNHWGHKVDIAYDGPSGLEEVKVLKPDLVLLDIGLPLMDGYELARAIRRDCGADAPPLAALTGYGKADDREQVMAEGFDAHFIKPVDLVQLQEFIRAL